MSNFTIELPSLGILYGDKIPDGKLTLKPLTAREQSILYSRGGDPMDKINQVIDNCIVDKLMPPQDLLTSDRVYILVVLRTRSFGAEYNVPMRCDSCQAQYVHKLTLTDEEQMKLKKMNVNTVEPIKCVLPISKDEITYRFLRGKDEVLIARNSKRVLMQTTDPADPAFSLRLATAIQTINGKELSMIDKEGYIIAMDAGDSDALSQDIDKNESGLDLTILSTCRACGFINENPMPFTTEFFRPRRS